MLGKLDNIPDIYFEEEYGKLSVLLEEEGSVVIPYNYKDENGEIYVLVIKRPINELIDGVRYYDITTPYGYGGPIIKKINNSIKDSKEKILKGFQTDFEKFCVKNNIISEFIRFHPIIENALDFKNIYETTYLQKTIATICNEGRPFEVEFSSGVRNIIRRNLKEGMSYEVIANPTDLTIFKEIYFETMDRLNAKSFYYFEDEYFEYMIENLKDKIVLINVKNEMDTIIASGIFFIHSNKFLHEHLSGTKTDYMKNSPAYSLKYAAAEWAHENGYVYAHSGGGTTTDENDSLLAFKKKFTKKGFFDFYIAKKIYMKDVYDKLVKITKTENSKFFPQYRDPKKV